jgi:hypothetical protein
MEDRIAQELALLRKRWGGLEYRDDGRWVKIPSYPLPEGWSARATDVAFQIPTGFPGAAPYGIYVPAGLRFRSETPANYTEPAGTQPPFGGSWGVFSWAPVDGEWRPTADPVTGSNLANWASGFADRFREGK